MRFTTPRAQAMSKLLGATTFGPNAMTRDEFDSIRRLYGFKPDNNVLLQAGADRNVVRHAECDGLRMLAWIARYVEPNGDPMKTLIQMAVDAGFDVADADAEWAEADE